LKAVLVCIITFRRAEQLQRLLQALGEQVVTTHLFKVQVVDNDPDGSAKSVCDAAVDLPMPVGYCLEPEPGIVAARNRCVAQFLESGAEYLAFIDDDEWPSDSDWIAKMLRCLEESSADIVAGDVLSVAGPGTPEWATRILYEQSQRKSGDPVDVFYTGNVLIARPVLEDLAPAFDERFALSGASDYHFALRCLQAGYKAVYANAIVIEEFPAERAKTSWFVKRGFRSGAGYTRSHLIEDSLLLTIARCLGLSIVRMVRGCLLLLRGLITFDKAMIVKGLFRCAAGVGTTVGLSGVTYQEYRKMHG